MMRWDDIENHFSFAFLTESVSNKDIHVFIGTFIAQCVCKKCKLNFVLFSYNAHIMLISPDLVASCTWNCTWLFVGIGAHMA